MVLERTEFDSTYDTPSSSLDPYDTDTTDPAQLQFTVQYDLNNFPRPFFLGRVFGYNERYLAVRVQQQLKFAAVLLRRAPIQDEVDAFIYHNAKTIRINSFGAPAGMAAGFWRAYETRATWKFPFQKVQAHPPEAWSTLRIGGLELVKGQAARLFWHAFRYQLYGALGYVFVNTVVGAYAATAGAVGLLQDKRLAEYQEALRQKSKEELEKGRKKTGLQTGQRAPRTVGDPTGQGQKQASELWKEHRESIRAKETRQRSSSFDDAGPTAAGFDDGDTYPSPAATEPTPQEPPYTSPSDYPRIGVPPSQRIPQRTRPQPPPPPSQEERDFDDASPTASAPESSQSAWARIRAEQMSSPAPASQRRQQRSSASEPRNSEENSFSYSGEDKERAQREFDERIERERQGGDFSGGNGGSSGRSGWGGR
ncbi:MAG: hypothetical protein MMC33_001792 [Icmadophila ericetorum]|nr:hypothetical protein [Icmadophila ericetorum]